jgi:tRNA(Ile)-lysidine synthase
MDAVKPLEGAHTEDKPRNNNWVPVPVACPLVGMFADRDPAISIDLAFATAMAQLGPFESAPRLAVGVSGGADSMALTVLAARWARARGGSIIGLIVDHCLRPGSGAEARITSARLRELGLPAQILVLTRLATGPRLAERARIARYIALQEACAAEGTLHLLLGHHAGDQAETVLQRALRGSHLTGLAGMAALLESAAVRLLRPLLGFAPEDLRTFLRSVGVAWVEDPSNRDQRALRPRLRASLGRRPAAARDIRAICQAAWQAGHARAEDDVRTAEALARRITLRPEGFAILPAERIPLAMMRALIQMIAGAPYPPGPDTVGALAAMPSPATVAGVQLLPAGRLGGGLLMVREAAAMEGPVAAVPGTCWDGRFRVGRTATLQPGLSLAALGRHAARFRGRIGLPSAVLRTLPALWADGTLVAVPHLQYPDASALACLPITFAPRQPACGAPFIPAGIAGIATTTGTQGDAGQHAPSYLNDR